MILSFRRPKKIFMMIERYYYDIRTLSLFRPFTKDLRNFNGYIWGWLAEL